MKNFCFIAPLAVSAIASLSSLSVNAAPVSPDQAVAIAMQAKGYAGRSAKAPSSLSPQIVFTRSAAGMDIALYAVAYGKERGFALVAGDSNAPAILGYSDEGSLDPANVPPALEALMQQYAVAVAAAAGSDTPYDPVRVEGRREILPIVTSTWNQTNPYNSYCPKTGVDRAPVGCVALAVGQVMRVHQWPPKSRGTVAYSAGRFKLNTEYDWASMPNSLLGTTSEVYDNAAKMLYEVARSTFMTFTGTSSGTFSYLVPDALVNNFAYDTSVDYISRNFFSDSQWEELVYSQLAAGQPVVYDAVAVSEGHCFIADGYDGKGYFHINWGWEGKSDGYFLLSGLDPAEQGVGGTTSGYFRRHGVVANIRAPKGGVQPVRLSLNGSLSQGEIPGTIRVDDYSFDGWSHEPGIFNYTGRDFRAAIGLRAVNVEEPSEITYLFEDARNWERWSSRTPYIKAKVGSLPDGRYYLYPVCRDEYGDIYEIDAPANASRVLQATVSGGNYTCSPAAPVAGVLPAGVKAENSSDALVVRTEPDLLLQPGYRGMLSAYIAPLDADAQLEWTSSDNDVAVVYDGMVFARGKIGSAVITASVKGNPSMACTFNVAVEEPQIIKSLSFSASKMAMLPGTSEVLAPVIAPERVSNRHLRFKSSDESVLTVDNLGNIKAGENEGIATVTAETLDGSELTAEIEVHVTTDLSGVEAVSGNLDPLAPSPVFTATGIRVSSACSETDLTTLPAGLYIWKGKKILIP